LLILPPLGCAAISQVKSIPKISEPHVWLAVPQSFFCHYRLQVPVEQVGQLELNSDDPLPPRTAPSLENSFSSLAEPHLRHLTSSSARLTSSSKVAPHLRQRNSYIGIVSFLSC